MAPEHGEKLSKTRRSLMRSVAAGAAATVTNPQFQLLKILQDSPISFSNPPAEK
jgi:hypothetical protein